MDTSYPSTNNLPLPGVTPSSTATSYPKADAAPAPDYNCNKDPYATKRDVAPVSHSAGDSPIVKSPVLAFRALNPYSRTEGQTPNPPDPREVFRDHPAQS